MRMSRRETLDFSRAANLMQFEGYGVIERVELVSQWDSKRRLPFSNYVFDCAVLSMKEENEEFDRSSDLSMRTGRMPRVWCR